MMISLGLSHQELDHKNNDYSDVKVHKKSSAQKEGAAV
jgi:hypothetical protein